MKTMPMPTWFDLTPLMSGVAKPMTGTISMQTAIPMAPVMSKNLRPYLSAVHAAFSVNRIPQVAFRALIKLMVFVSGQIFL